MKTRESIVLAIVAGTLLDAAADSLPYGICAHLAGDEFPEMSRSLAMMEAAGVQFVRTDFPWRDCERDNGSFDFSRFDAVVAEAQRRGIRVSPVLGVPPKHLGIWREEILDDWGRYVRAVAVHFKGRIPDYEIVNEANGDPQLKNPRLYAMFLKRAAREIRAADPAAKISTTGAIRVPIDWFRSLYKAGSRDDFDILAIHPYTAPHPPESTERDIAALRTLMNEYGDGTKPIRINEVGWPTHRVGIGTHSSALLELTARLAFSERKAIRVAYADMASEDAEPDKIPAETILQRLPSGSTLMCLSPGRLADALAADEIDMVVFLGEDYSPRIVAPLADFLRTGGVVVHGNAMPMYYARERLADGTFADCAVDSEAARRALRLKVSATWIDPAYGGAKRGMMTDEAKRLGFKGDLGSYKARLFVENTYLAKGDRFIRLIGGVTDAGKEFTSMAIVQFDSDWKGVLAVSALDEDSWTPVAGNAETHQAVCLARGLGLAMALGIEAYYPYEFRAPETDPYYSEANFGLVHKDFSPKPAWSAYSTFVAARPGGSVNLDLPWRSDDGKRYSPRWRRPDGMEAGMVWRTDSPRAETLDFGRSGVRFLDYLGSPVIPLETGSGVYLLEVGPKPIYFFSRTGGVRHE